MKKLKLDQYFLTERNPYNGKRGLNFKNLKIFAIVSGIFIVAGILFFGGNAEKKIETGSLVTGGDVSTPASKTTSEGSIEMGTSGISTTQAGRFAGSYSPGIPSASSGRSSRQYTASQLVRSSDGGMNGSALPMGTTFKALLVNTLLSSDSAQPVIADISDTVFWKNSVFIPEGTRAIGSASFDDAAKRLQIRFHTLVFPGGDQHSVSALALLADGSSGIPGDFHSGEAQKQTGRFLGNFVGGLADGMKDKQAGSFGTTIEPGSLKNGILNGLTLSALDQSKRFSDEVQEVKPYLEVPGGTSFLMYLEKEYVP